MTATDPVDPARLSLPDRQKLLAGYLISGLPPITSGWPVKSSSSSVGNSTIENLCLPVTRGPKDHGSDGAYQWREDRLDGPNGLKMWAAAHGFDWRSLKAQAAFHQFEVARDYPSLNADLKAGKKSIETLTANICDQYERPAAAYAALDKRIAAANATYAAIQREPKPGPVIVTGGATTGGVIAAQSMGNPAIAIAIICVAIVLGLFYLWWTRGRKLPVNPELTPAQKLKALNAEIRALVVERNVLIVAMKSDMDDQIKLMNEELGLGEQKS